MKMLAERFIFPWNEIEANKTLYKGWNVFTAYIYASYDDELYCHQSTIRLSGEEERSHGLFPPK